MIITKLCDKNRCEFYLLHYKLHRKNLTSKMRISIIGTGYVGLITGICFAELGNEVTCVDVIEEKVLKINKGESPIYEDGLDELLKKNIGKNLKASTDLEHAVLNSDITFICVGTPDAPDGGIDLKYIKLAAEGVGRAIGKRGYHVIVVKSTVVPGTTDSVVLPIIEKESKKQAGSGFGVCMNPEFLREGRAIDDFMHPDRVVIGALDEKSASALRSLYNGFECKKLETDLRTAEMIKYASNALLATKISFINEIANICELVGTDVVDVARGVGLDARISPQFLQAGAGFGGSCFPKDVKALAEMGRQNGLSPLILDAVLQRNEKQAHHVVDALHQKTEIDGKLIAILGLAFKPGTDDIRESPALKIIPALLERGAKIRACDPIAMENSKVVFGDDIDFADSFEECIWGCDACVILTDWKEFKKSPVEYSELMKGSVIIDGRRILDPKAAKDAGLDYFGIGYGKDGRS
jgi:UDPglucose 6-dehydrogenase